MNKIIDAIKNKDVRTFFEIYDNFLDCIRKTDLLQIFDEHGVGFLEILCDKIKNTIDEDPECPKYLFRFELRHDKDVSQSIGKAVTEILKTREVTEHDPLFRLQLIEYLTTFQIQELIDTPEFDYLDLLLMYKDFCKCTFYGDRYRYSGANRRLMMMAHHRFKTFIYNKLKTGNLTDFRKMWKYNGWEHLNSKEIEELLENKELNLLENLFRMIHGVALENNFEAEDFYIGGYLLPMSCMSRSYDIIETQVVQIIRKKDMDTFVPLLVHNYLSYLSEDKIIALVKDPEVNLLKLVVLAIQTHSDELYYFNELSFEKIEDFFKIIKKIDFLEIKPVICEIIKSLGSIKYSSLIMYGLLEKLEYSDLLSLIKDMSAFKIFLESLDEASLYFNGLYNDYYYYGDEDEEYVDFGYMPFYYEKLGQFLPDKLKTGVVKIIEESEPEQSGLYGDEYKWTLPIILEKIGCYEVLHLNDLKLVNGIIKKKSGNVIFYEKKLFKHILQNIQELIDKKEP